MNTKDFKIIDILNWQPQIEIDPLKIKELTISNGQSYPFYGQATLNNGVISYEKLDKKVLNNIEGKPTILIHSNNQNIVYLETPFYLKDGHGATSVLQSEHLDKDNALYIIASIKKVIEKKFEYNEKATKIALKNTIISLPITASGEPNYKYMSSYIRSQKEKINKTIKSLIISEGFKSSTYDKQELNAHNEFIANKIVFKEFKAKDLFKVISNPQLNKDSFTFSSNSKYPYFTRTTLNNGILGYVDYLDEEHKIKGNSIAVGMLGMQFFYMKNDFYAGQFTKTLFPTFDEFDEDIALYFTTLLNKNSQIYLGCLVRDFEKTFNATTLLVPTDGGSINYDYIRNIIRYYKRTTLNNFTKGEI